MKNFLTRTFTLVGLYSFSLASISIASASTPAPSHIAEKPLCRIEVDSAHPSTYFRNQDVSAVKVNARSVCNVIQREVLLKVQLFKVGLFFDHLVATSTTKASSASSQGKRVENNDTYRVCINRKVSRYYGVASATAIINGQRVAAPPARSREIVPIACGT